ncbi:MAG: hypothetical protein GY924_14705 [Planctomycetaceae bacterium]|nr:hypothetical protein [Planctomycetaceae bacterium]
MRDHQEPQTDRTKRSRRRWLLALVLAGSPCLAQEPQNGGFGALPPLPLNATNAAATVRTNPYCAPQNEAPQPAVRLTTGASQASRSVHLRPIGAAIGLNPIGAEQGNKRPAERGPIMTIEPAHESVVQINPLLQSVHHQNNDLVEAKLAPAQAVSHSTPQAAVAVPTPVLGTAPAATAGEASILLVTPAPKPLLVVKPQTAVIPVPQTAVIPVPQISAKAPTAAQATGSAKPPASAKPLAKPITPTEATTTDATLPPVKPEKTASEKSVEGASIASMLTQNPQSPTGASEKEKAAPIFFSLSDSTEVAPSKEVLPRSKTINLPSLGTIADQKEVPSVPLTVTVKEDGSIVTAERKKPARSTSKKSTIPQPILAGENTLGTGLDLPTPTALPEAVSEPKRMSALPKTAKRITPNGKSILSTTGPSPSDEHESLSVATTRKFKPRTGSGDVKAITPAKPFSIFGEKAKPMSEASPSGKAISVIAQSPSGAKPALTTESDSGKLTLPTPINIDSDVASSEPAGKSGRSVIKVENPSPKDSAKSNPHAEVTSTDSGTELVNPFNRKQDARTAAAKKIEFPQTTQMNQAVRVEKFKISKDRPRVRVNLDSVLGTEKNTQQSPIASGVVTPIALPDSIEQKPATASVATTKPATEITQAKPSAAPLKTTTNSAVATAASSGAANSGVANSGVASSGSEAVTSVAKKSTGTAEQNAETSILRKRYRPPVAVQAIPGTVTRHNAIASNDSPKVQAVPEMVIGDNKTQPPAVDLKQAMRLDTASELKDRSLVLGPDVKVTPLHMNQAQVRSLTLGGSVRGVRVGDKGVCQAFASGPNQLKLIGTGIGTTRLVVWAQKDGENDEVLMRAFEIHVDEVVPSEGNSIESTTKLLNQSIQKVFPRSQAKVQLVKGELWVTGTCESQDSAEKIIRMVRKSCLIPVRDQLTVK